MDTIIVSASAGDSLRLLGAARVSIVADFSRFGGPEGVTIKSVNAGYVTLAENGSTRIETVRNPCSIDSEVVVVSGDDVFRTTVHSVSVFENEDKVWWESGLSVVDDCIFPHRCIHFESGWCSKCVRMYTLGVLRLDEMCYVRTVMHERSCSVFEIVVVFGESFDVSGCDIAWLLNSVRHDVEEFFLLSDGDILGILSGEVEWDRPLVDEILFAYGIKKICRVVFDDVI